MVRKFEKKSSKVLEDIVEESLKIVGIETDEGKIKLLLRLVMSGIANHYFFSPDDLIEVGFLQFCKSPDKDELFRINILRDKESGVINANTLWKFYKGELQQEKDFKRVLDNFLQELISYSQIQEMSIMNLTNVMEKRKGETNHGI